MINKNRVHLYLDEKEMNNLDELNKKLGISKSKIISILVKTLYENKDNLIGLEDVVSKVLKNG